MSQSMRRGKRPGRRRSLNVRRWARLIALATALLLLVQWLLAGSTLDALPELPARVLIVTAHPDDEAMFFAPIILSFVARGVQIDAVCLSLGNANGLGNTRALELEASYDILGVTNEFVSAIDDVHLQDGMDVQWDPALIIRHLEARSVSVGLYDMIVTFDQHGISGHANHRACFDAVKRYAELQASQHGRALQTYVLQSLPIAFKFFGLPRAIVGRASAMAFGSPQSKVAAAATVRLPFTISFLSSPMDYIKSLQAMSKHRSQLVWFRYLYVVFSTYMYGATLVRVPGEISGADTSK